MPNSDRKPKRKGSFWKTAPGFLTAAATFIAAVTTLLTTLKPFSPSPSKDSDSGSVTVPDVCGRSIERARETLQQSQLVAIVVAIAANSDFGNVTTQDPLKGKKVDKSSEVKLYVAAYQLEDLVGTEKFQAEKTLLASKVKVSWTQPQLTSTRLRQVKPYTVIRQSRPMGTLLVPGDAISLTVEDRWARVPHVKGRLLSDALPIIRSAQLDADWSSVDPTRETLGIPEFIVLNQDPAADEITPVQAKVHLICQGRRRGVVIQAPPPRPK